MKYLLLFAVLGVIWWVWKKRDQMPGKTDGRPHDRPAEKMLVCASCGVHFPESDAVSDGEAVYCCTAHRQARRGRG